MASHISAYTPDMSRGFLPGWLIFIAVVSLGNSVQTYVSLKGTREVYAGNASSSFTSKPPEGIPARALKYESPVNKLSARTFGTWTALSSIIRLYGAYHIKDQAMYDVTMWTFGIAFAHFMSEWLVFGTAKWGRGLAGPAAVATGTGTWMVLQRASYVM